MSAGCATRARRSRLFLVSGQRLAEIGFYHLLATPLERALPRLLERARAAGYRIVLRAASPERVEHLNALLWSYDEASFLPHGSARDGSAAAQPIWLTERDDNPNGATMLMLVDGVDAADLAAFARCADLFDGNDDSAVGAARERWRRAAAQGHQLTYWQQTATGWEKRG
jgi:DNA polymerase III subunit chi